MMAIEGFSLCFVTTSLSAHSSIVIRGETGVRRSDSTRCRRVAVISERNRELLERLGSVRQAHATVVGHQNRVRVSEASLAGHVDPRLDADQHPRFELPVVSLGDVGGLVAGDAEAVPGTVEDAISVAATGD